MTVHFSVGDTATSATSAPAVYTGTVVGVRRTAIRPEIAVIWDHDTEAGPTGWMPAEHFARVILPATDADLAAAVSEAVAMLDREEHRYVERFLPCPNGCTFDVRGDRRLTGPNDCDLCDYGSVEDEDAPQINPLLALLREAAARLATLED